MKRLLAVLLLSVILLSGCSSKTAAHSIPMDQMTLRLPGSFTELSTEDTLIYWEDPVYIHIFRESKQELLQYFEYVSLETYVRMLAEDQEPVLDAFIENDFWTYSYSADLDGMEYTFLCVFYETDESFWRVQAGCPAEQFTENRPNMWDLITAID